MAGKKITLSFLCCCLLFYVPVSRAAAMPQVADGVPAQTVQISATQQLQLRQQPRQAALVWHGASAWINAVTAGARAEFAAAGVTVVAVTDANYDPARQAADIDNVSTLKPDFILSLVIDAASVKNSYQRAVSQGSRLVLLSNPIAGFSHPTDYAGIVTDDMVGMGQQAAAELARYASAQGATAAQPLSVGMIFHDADYFITNTRDRAFAQALQQYPQLRLIAKKGFVREQETAEVAAALLLQQPGLDLLYVSWDAAAEGVVEALRAAGNKKVRLVTHDLGVNNLLDLARGGNLLATIADRPYLIGQTMARLALLAELGETTPALTLVPFDAIRRDNIQSGWQQSFQSPLPALLQSVLAKEHLQ